MTTQTVATRDEIGAHVSNAGGVQHAPARAAALGSTVFQLFTKQAQRWAEPDVTECATAFRAEGAAHGMQIRSAHDSYLINLASPDATLRNRSIDSFAAELTRCALLGIELIVTHPGNATDGDHASGLERNADGLLEALDRAGTNHDTRILLEGTAGTGNSLGASFEQLAQILMRVDSLRDRFGVCVDTCHLYAAGYDLRDDFDGVFERFDDLIGLERIGMFHLNDSATPFASRRDRHADIGEGSLGDVPFRRIVTDDRFLSVPKVIETPKLPDVMTADVRNIGRLRSYRAAG